MADLEEKKDKFSAAINHYAEEQRQKIEKEIAEYKSKQLQETENQVLLECYQMIQKELAQMRSRISQENAQREMDARRKLLKRRSEITAEVFSHVTDKLNEFVKSNDYAAFLEKSSKNFAEVFGQPGVTIFLKSDDVKYEDAIRKAFGFDCEFQMDGTIEIGGIKAFQPEMGILVDETLDSLLEDQHAYFESHSGLTVV
jgi:V/A-type H+-transporting ATPase subunit E